MFQKPAEGIAPAFADHARQAFHHRSGDVGFAFGQKLRRQDDAPQLIEAAHLIEKVLRQQIAGASDQREGKFMDAAHKVAAYFGLLDRAGCGLLQAGQGVCVTAQGAPPCHFGHEQRQHAVSIKMGVFAPQEIVPPEILIVRIGRVGDNHRGLALLQPDVSVLFQQMHCLTDAVQAAAVLLADLLRGGKAVALLIKACQDPVDDLVVDHTVQGDVFFHSVCPFSYGGAGERLERRLTRCVWVLLYQIAAGISLRGQKNKTILQGAQKNCCFLQTYIIMVADLRNYYYNKTGNFADT